jgi:hypothetical protein
MKTTIANSNITLKTSFYFLVLSFWFSFLLICLIVKIL